MKQVFPRYKAFAQTKMSNHMTQPTGKCITPPAGFIERQPVQAVYFFMSY